MRGTQVEAEQVFLNRPLVAGDAPKHAATETRQFVLGWTDMRSSKKVRAVPAFQSEAGERAFWEAHDTTEYVGWSKAKVAIFPNLRPDAPKAGAPMNPQGDRGGF